MDDKTTLSSQSDNQTITHLPVRTDSLEDVSRSGRTSEATDVKAEQVNYNSESSSNECSANSTTSSTSPNSHTVSTCSSSVGGSSYYHLLKWMAWRCTCNKRMVYHR